MKTTAAVSILMLIVISPAAASTVTVSIDTVSQGDIPEEAGTVALQSNQGIVRLTLKLFTELELDPGDANGLDGVAGFCFPGVFSNTGLKMQPVNFDYENNPYITHGNRYLDLATHPGIPCGADDLHVPGGGICAGMFTFGSTGPNVNPDLWIPGSTSGKTTWGTLIVTVNTDIGLAHYRVTLDPGEGLQDPQCSPSIGPPVAVIGTVPWIPDDPDAVFPLNGPGFYDAHFADNVLFGNGLDIYVAPEPMGIVVLIGAGLLLLRRRQF